MTKIYVAFILMLSAFSAKAQFPAPYCAEIFPNGVEPITSVVFNTISNTSPAALTSPAHENFTSISTTVQRGSTYIIQVKGNTDGNFQDSVAVFIDFNNNGVFTDAGESFTVGALTNSTGTDAVVASAGITIPASAIVGALRMRVSKKYALRPTPCNAATPGVPNYGQAEDYTLNVVAATPCSGTPNGGAVSPASAISCSGSTVTLTSIASNVGTGLTYQWQSSAAGANAYTNIAGATSNTYAAAPAANTDYRIVITCTSSGLSATSTAARVSPSTAPANDSVCSAITLTLNGPANCGNTTCATGYGTGTTGVAGNPAFSSSTPNNTVWYTYTPTTTGTAQVRFKRPLGVTTGLLNGWLGIYTVSGACPYTFTEITSSTVQISYDLTTSDSVSVITPSLTAGTTYYFMIDGFSGASGAFCIQVLPLPSPPACATLLQPANGSTNVNNFFTLTWRRVANATAYEVYLGTTNPPTSIGSTTDTAVQLPSPTPNTTYYWYVVPSSLGVPATGCNTNVYSFTTQASPANDNCSGAITLTQGTTYIGTSVGATQSQTPSACSGSTSGAAYDVWFRTTATRNGSLTVSMVGDEGFDGVLSIYTGTCGALVLVDTCSDVTADGGTETITVTNAIAGTIYYFRVYAYTPGTDSVGLYGIAVSGAALPVTGVTLSAIRNGSKAQLSWKTLTEINNVGFQVQRSADGKNFTGIANIASKATGGNSTDAIAYNFDDVRPLAGANYYRLKQTDKDGKTSFSNIVYLKGTAVSSLTLSAVYPNPTRDVLKASVQAPAAESITFIVTDMMGKTISRQVANVISGDNNVNINVANLPSGMYLLKAICRNGCETAYQKFTKQ